MRVSMEDRELIKYIILHW